MPFACLFQKRMIAGPIPLADRAASLINEDSCVRIPVGSSVVYKERTPANIAAFGKAPVITTASMEETYSKMERGDRVTVVYHRLRELIVRGRLAPGARIIETVIAARLGVSRTPVRAALQRLQQEGYVVVASPGQ